MRDNLERVNIVLTKEQHKRFREYAQKYHGSLSQFLRLAAENESDDNDAFMINLRPIIKKLDELEDFSHQILEKIDKIYHGAEYLVDRLGNKSGKIADDIEKLLLQKGIGLSIPEIGKYLPYKQEEIISGIEKLVDEFAIVKIERVNAPSMWRIRGE